MWSQDAGCADVADDFQGPPLQLFITGELLFLLLPLVTDPDPGALSVPHSEMEGGRARRPIRRRVRASIADLRYLGSLRRQMPDNSMPLKTDTPASARELALVIEHVSCLL